MSSLNLLFTCLVFRLDFYLDQVSWFSVTVDVSSECRRSVWHTGTYKTSFYEVDRACCCCILLQYLRVFWHLPYHFAVLVFLLFEICMFSRFTIVNGEN
jgi:hypothetical protein